MTIAKATNDNSDPILEERSVIEVKTTKPSAVQRVPLAESWMDGAA